jgi:hypothetical protein
MTLYSKVAAVSVLLFSVIIGPCLALNLGSCLSHSLSLGLSSGEALV